MRATLLVLLSFLAFYSSFAQSPAYQEKVVIGSTPNFDLGGMATDREDNIYVIDKTRILKLKDGEVISEFTINKEEYANSYISDGVPGDIAVDSQGNIYLLNRVKKLIEKHDPAGRLLKVFGNTGEGPNKYAFPQSILFDRDSNLCIFDGSTRKLYKYSTEGEFVKTVAIADAAPEYHSLEIAIALDRQNNIYVADTKYLPEADREASGKTYFNSLIVVSDSGDIIQRYSKDVIEESGIVSFTNMEIDKYGDIYLSNTGSVIYVFSPSGGFKKMIKTYDITTNAYFYGNFKICFDSQNNLYLGNYDEYGSSIRKYGSDHIFIEQWGSLRRPYEVVYDKDNNLYMLDLFKNEIVKLSPEGEEIMVFGGKGAGIVNPLTLAVDDQGFIYVLDIVKNRTHVKKYSPSGNLITSYTNIAGFYEISYGRYTSAGLAVDLNGNFYVTSHNTNAFSKYNSQGILLYTFGTAGKGAGQLWKPLDVSVDAGGNVYIADINGHRIQKFSSTGKFILQYGSFRTDEYDSAGRGCISSDAFGNTVVSSMDGVKSKVTLYDISGKAISSLPGGTPSVTMSEDGKLIAAADNYKDIVTVYETASTREYNLIEGNIYHDANANCIQDEVETGLADILVKAEPGPYYGATDKLGNFRFFVGKGNYTVSPITENSSGKMISQPCTSGGGAASINFADYGNYSTGNDAGVQVILSPYLTASVSSTRRRRCFESTTKLTYSNTGFAPAQNAKVYLQLPEQVELLSANKPYTRLPDGTYVFEAGTVAPGQTSVITVQDKVVCGDESIRGLTVCTKAWITPSNQPPTAPPTAVSAVTAKCDAATGYVRFVIRNTGQADMATGEQFRVYQDGKLATIENYQLATGDSMVLRVPAMGRTVRLEADQPDGNGDNTLASATVEACRAGGSPVAFSTGLVNAMPADDEEAEVAEECLPIIDSFDPNDKAVFPTGVTTENFTPTSTALHYKIRFQNTGTDLAYRVVVVDTLSEHLDISTLQLGSASHNYIYAVSGKGRPVLTWTLDNIMLPDSTTNEPGSHGYIQFSIKPKADLPEKTTIENLADIFFDFNSPVRTNATVNRIYDVPREVLAENRITSEEIIMTPVIQAFSPAAGKPGAEVLITGTKFSEDAHRNKVYINGVQAEIVEGTATILKVRVPESARTGTLSVVTEHAGVSSKAAFVVYQPPVVSGFSPTEGVVGAEVTLHGSYLAEGVLESVKIGELICEVISATPEALVLRVPEGASSGKFQVLTMGGEAESAAPYIVWHQPQISSLSKRTDRVGSELFIYGDNFSTVASRNIVTIGQVPAGVLQASATSLKVRVPQGAASGYITVETPGGAALSAMAFEVIPAPVLLSVSPVRGSVGSVVELKGEHFSVLGQQDTVLFNGLKALVLHAGETSLTVRVPRGAQTGKVQVTGIGGSTLSATDFVVEEQTPHQAIAVYPNPTTGRFTIDFMKADFDVLQVEIFNTIGALVLYQAVDQENALEIDLTAPGAGLYHIRVSTSRGKVSKRLSVL